MGTSWSERKKGWVMLAVFVGLTVLALLIPVLQHFATEHQLRQLRDNPTNASTPDADNR